MNKGFIMDGFPRSQDDAKMIFMDKIPVTEEVAENEDPEGAAEEAEPKFEEKLNEKIIPQYTIALEADDAALTQRAKDLPPAQTADTHHNETGMVRRLKDYRGRNVEDSGETVRDFFTWAIGPANVLTIDAMTPEAEQILKMQEIIEQKGKPCCINMITDSDKKFMEGLKKAAAKIARAEARAAAKAAALEAEGSVEQSPGEETQRSVPADLESEEEVDEIALMIQKEDQEHAERSAAEEALKKQQAVENEQKRVKEAKEKIKMEKLREQERDLLDQRSQPIR